MFLRLQTPNQDHRSQMLCPTRNGKPDEAAEWKPVSVAEQNFPLRQATWKLKLESADRAKTEQQQRALEDDVANATFLRMTNFTLARSSCKAVNLSRPRSDRADPSADREFKFTVLLHRFETFVGPRQRGHWWLFVQEEPQSTAAPGSPHSSQESTDVTSIASSGRAKNRRRSFSNRSSRSQLATASPPPPVKLVSANPSKPSRGADKASAGSTLPKVRTVGQEPKGTTGSACCMRATCCAHR